MTTFKIAKFKEKILRTKAEKITDFKSQETKDLINGLKETLTAHEDPKGIGLAGPQIYSSKRIFVFGPFRSDSKENYIPLTIAINPEIIWKSKEKQTNWEGCLSLPDLWGPVVRPNEIKVKFKNEDANDKEIDLKGFPATVFLHEYDHLEGILFTDRVKDKSFILNTEEYQRRLEEIRIIESQIL